MVKENICLLPERLIQLENLNMGLEHSVVVLLNAIDSS